MVAGYPVEPVTLLCEGRTSDTALVTLAAIALPSGTAPRRAHLFVVGQGTTCLVSVVGAAGKPYRRVVIESPELRQVGYPSKMGWQAATDLGSSVRYAWANVVKTQPYLIVGLVSGGAGTAIAADDLAAPTFTRSASVAATTQIGFALLIQPKDQTMRVDVPKALATTAIFAIPYGAAYQGSDL
jgi:hypothetical protein